MFGLCRSGLRRSTLDYSPKRVNVRQFWEYVNMMFNKPDPDRIKQVGPDRACAEWVLRNGGAVAWVDGKKLSDYNLLPLENQPTPKLLEIDGSSSSISHYGFPHLQGCTMLKKIILHNAGYIDNRALEGLRYGKATLKFVQVSKCPDVSDDGIKSLKSLNNLETLVLFQLEGVTNLDNCKQYLQTQLPKCKIEGSADKCNEEN